MTRWCNPRARTKGGQAEHRDSGESAHTHTFIYLMASNQTGPLVELTRNLENLQETGNKKNKTKNTDS